MIIVKFNIFLIKKRKVVKNILIVIDNLCGGGAERVLKDLLMHLDKSKYNIEILLKYKQGVYLKEVNKDYKVMSFSKDREEYSNIAIFRKLKSLYLITKNRILSSDFFINKIIEDKYDIEIAFLEGWSTSIVSRRRNKSKKIAWVHTDLEKRKISNKDFEGEQYSLFDKIIAVSKDSAKSVENLYPENKNKIEVIFNPIDVELIKEMSKEHSVKFPTDRFNLIAVGRLNYVKGYDILLKAHKELIEEGVIHNLYIIGKGEEEQNLKKYISENKIESSVTLLGFKPNPYPYILNSDGFVLSSRNEGYPLVLAEALVLGRPIIATRCTGPKELLNNGEYGIMAEVNNIQSLKEGIKELIINDNKRDYYREKSLLRSKIFNIKDIIQDVENLFSNI